MFIEAVSRRARPPPGCPCLDNPSLVFDDRHGPDGGRETPRGVCPWIRLPPINMTLLAEGKYPHSSPPTCVGLFLRNAAAWGFLSHVETHA